MSIADALFHDVEPQVVLPAQFFDAMRPGPLSTGERRLALAVLGDGLSCYFKYANSKTAGGRLLFHEAQDWIFSTTDCGPFGFENICETLDIQPWSLRRILMKVDSKSAVTLSRRRLKSGVGEAVRG
jgi:hypothetical protein